MRAAVVRQPSPDAVPEVVERDEPTSGEGETLIRVTAVSLAHLDVSVGTGDFAGSPPPPYVLGGDGAGVVLRSTSFAEGTPVWVRGGGLGVSRDGLASERACVPDGAVHAAPPEIDPALAAAFFSPTTSAHVAVHDLGALRSGQRVLVTGAAGSVGALAVQLAAEAGATVIGTVSREERRADVPPAAESILVGDQPVLSPVDLLIDTVGGPGLPGRIAAVVPGGRAVLVGYTAGTALSLHLPTLLRSDVTLVPLNMQRRAPQAFARADDLLRRLDAGELALLVACYPLAEVATAWADLRGNRARGRVVLLP